MADEEDAAAMLVRQEREPVQDWTSFARKAEVDAPGRRYRTSLPFEKWRIACHPSCMAPAGLAGVLFVVFAASLTPQGATTGKVVITVVDRSGAVIPGARVGIIQLPMIIPNGDDWLHYALSALPQASTDANANGEVTIGLARGSYVVSIAYRGFEGYLQRFEVRDESSQSLRATLVASRDRTDCMACFKEPEIPLECTSLNIFIPLEPLQTIALTSIRVRRRRE